MEDNEQARRERAASLREQINRARRPPDPDELNQPLERLPGESEKHYLERLEERLRHLPPRGQHTGSSERQ